jgi:integrase/recombinase XerD
MASSKGEARKPKAPRGTYWRGNVLWARFQTDGSDERVSLHTDDPAIAQARRSSLKQRKVAVAKFGDDRKPFDEVMASWATHIVRNVSAQTAKRYAVSLAQLQPFLDGLYIDEVDHDLVGEIVDARVAQSVSNATIKRDLCALSSVIQYARARKWRSMENPALDWMQLVTERRDPVVLPSHEDIELVASRASPGLANLIRAAVFSGCRISELTAAKRSQLDVHRKQLTVIGKRNKLRVIDLDAWGFEFFAGLPQAPGGQPWLFWHHDGEAYSTASQQFERLMSGLIEQAQKQARPEQEQAQHFRFHDLRHRHAVDWLKSGRSIYDLQLRLGHTSVKTTEIYLTYLTPEEQRKVKFSEHTTGTKTGPRIAVLSRATKRLTVAIG